MTFKQYLDTMRAPHFHVCRRDGPDDGPLFLQHEAWVVRDMVLDHVCRLARREAL